MADIERQGRRCTLCSRRLAVVAQPCRCGHKYCPSHRLPETHACTFDYKEDGRRKLAELWTPKEAKTHDRGGGGGNMVA